MVFWSPTALPRDYWLGTLTALSTDAPLPCLGKSRSDLVRRVGLVRLIHGYRRNGSI